MKVLIAADFAPQNRVSQLIEKEDYKVLFDNIRDIVSSSDYSIVNLESPIVEYQAKPISKTGPNIKCHKNTAAALSYAGFNCVTLANNHFYDYGETGVVNTIDNCRQLGIDTVGGGRNLKEAEEVLYKDICSKRIAIINVCENEWSIATDHSGGSAPLNIIRNCKHIKNAKANADYVIMITHGGTEHYQFPTPRMKETYRFFVDNGADAIINHHQHCYSGYEIYNGKPIFYGLGNFFFDKGGKTPKLWNEGYMVILDLLNNEIKFEIKPYSQCVEEPNIVLFKDTSDFDKNILKLNSIICDDEKLETSFNEMVNAKKSYMDFLEPFQGELISKLRYHKLIPRLICENQKRLILEIFRCEAHRDIMFNLLK